VGGIDEDTSHGSDVKSEEETGDGSNIKDEEYAGENSAKNGEVTDKTSEGCSHEEPKTMARTDCRELAITEVCLLIKIPLT